MAGLCAAARARELGLDAVVYEKGTRPGGSMLLSSCVVWRYRTLEDFRTECPGGDPRLQQLIIERFDDALAWLESLGPPVVWEETGNPRTIGKRFDPRGLTEVLVRAAGDARLETPFPTTAEPLAPRDRRLPGRRGARPPLHHPEPVAPPCESVELGRRPALRARAWRRPLAGDGRVLRPRDARSARSDHRGPLRRARAAVRQLRPRSERGGRGVRA